VLNLSFSSAVALKIRTEMYGQNDERVAVVLQYMGTMEFRSGDLDTSLNLLNEFIRIRRENRVPHDGDYVNVLFMIGNIHKMQGDDEEARVCWTEAYDVFQELGLATENPQIAKVMNNLLYGEQNPIDEPAAEEEATETKRPGLLSGISSRFKDALRDEKMPKYGKSY
jgi:tetratricopeptide (TPR) repeat protein